MFRNGTRIRVRDAFDWHSDSLYTPHMDGLQGKFGVVKDVRDNRVYVKLDDTDNRANWVFYPKDLEELDWHEGDLLELRRGAIADDHFGLYFDGMRSMEGKQLKFIRFDTCEDRQVVIAQEVGHGGDRTFWLKDVSPISDESFCEDFSLESLLA